MDKFYIITNSDKDKNLEITKKIEDYLKAKGKECQVQLAERKQEGSYHYTNPDLIPEGTECILVLGETERCFRPPETWYTGRSPCWE